MPDPHQAITRALITEFGEQIQTIEPVATIEPGSAFDRDLRSLLAKIERRIAADKAAGT
jgi:hypothetical protein